MIWHTGVVKRMTYLACFRCLSWFCYSKLSIWTTFLLDYCKVCLTEGMCQMDLLLQRFRPQPQWANLGLFGGALSQGDVVAAEGGIFLVAFFCCTLSFLPFGFSHFSILYTHPLPLSSAPLAHIKSIPSLLLNRCDYFVLGSRMFYNFALWFSDWFGFWIIDFVLLPHLNCPYDFSAMSCLTANWAPASASVKFSFLQPWSAKCFQHL